MFKIWNFKWCYVEWHNLLKKSYFQTQFHLKKNSNLATWLGFKPCLPLSIFMCGCIHSIYIWGCIKKVEFCFGFWKICIPSPFLLTDGRLQGKVCIWICIWIVTVLLFWFLLTFVLKNYICGKPAFNLLSFFLMGGLNILNMYWLWGLHSSPRVGFPKQHL